MVTYLLPKLSLAFALFRPKLGQAFLADPVVDCVFVGVDAHEDGCQHRSAKPLNVEWAARVCDLVQPNLNRLGLVQQHLQSRFQTAHIGVDVRLSVDSRSVLVILKQQKSLKLLFGEAGDVFGAKELAVLFDGDFLCGDLHRLLREPVGKELRCLFECHRGFARLPT